jgi:DNA-binding NtrC family response regulator
MTTGRCVLLVMRRDHRTEFLALLDRIGLPVLAATRCAKATKYLRAPRSIAAVLTDTDLVDGNWETLLKQVHDQCPEIPVVAVLIFQHRNL